MRFLICGSAGVVLAFGVGYVLAGGAVFNHFVTPMVSGGGAVVGLVVGALIRPKKNSS